MALVIKLKRGTTEIDLVGGSGKLAPETWRSFEEGGRVTETFLLVVEGGTRAAVRAAYNDILEMLEAAVRWQEDNLEDAPVWFQLATDGETLKQALVYSYRLSPTSWSGITPMLLTAGGRQAVWELAITRDRAWELLTATTETISGLSATGGVSDQTDIAGGQANGRIALTRFQSPAETFEKLWVGLHRLRLGDAGDVKGVVDLDGTYPADADVIAESNTFGGDTVRVTFSIVPDWQFRCYATLPLDTGGGTAAHYTGRWLVLLRARTSIATEVMARVTLSHASPPVFTSIPTALYQGPPVYISNPVYYLYEMGEFQFPPSGRAAPADDLLTGLRLNVEARRIAGAQNFYADCLILIPADHMLAVSNARLTPTFNLYIEGREDGREIAVTRHPGQGETIVELPTLTARNWRWPKEGAVVVYAAERGGGHDVDDVGHVQFTIYERWLGYHE